MRKRPRPDQIAAILRDFQADLDAGLNIDQACRKAGIGPTTYYRWKARQALGYRTPAQFSSTCVRYVPIDEDLPDPSSSESTNR